MSHFNSKGTEVASARLLLTATVRWPNVALLAIELAKAGCEVFAVCPDRHPLLKTRAIRQTFRYSGFRPVESLKAAVESVNPDIIIPCDDRAVQHLHELHAEAQASGVQGQRMMRLIENSLGPLESFSIVLARYDLLRIAREEGVLVPDTKLILTADDLKSWQSQAVFPWVLKADGTSAGNGVKIAHTFKQAEQYLFELGRYYGFGRAIKWQWVNRDPFWLRPWWKNVTPTVTAQSYIRGYPANCAVACWKGELLAGIGVEVVSTKGETGPATVVRVTENAEMMKAAERIAKRLRLSGFFGLDFMIEEGSGSTYLIEMNPRATRVSCFRLGKGRDPVGALCAQLMCQVPEERPPVTEKKMIAYFPDSLRCTNEVLSSSFQDEPEGEPELIQELLKPWPPEGFVWHLFNRADQVKAFLEGSNSSSQPDNGDER